MRHTLTTLLALAAVSIWGVAGCEDPMTDQPPQQPPPADAPDNGADQPDGGLEGLDGLGDDNTNY